jgi:hypothetical protein
MDTNGEYDGLNPVRGPPRPKVCYSFRSHSVVVHDIDLRMSTGLPPSLAGGVMGCRPTVRWGV